jgi:hypothetical protein
MVTSLWSSVVAELFFFRGGNNLSAQLCPRSLVRLNFHCKFQQTHRCNQPQRKYRGIEEDSNSNVIDESVVFRVHNSLFS